MVIEEEEEEENPLSCATDTLPGCKVCGDYLHFSAQVNATIYDPAMSWSRYIRKALVHTFHPPT